MKYKKNIQSILQDILILDPSMQAHKKELTHVIEVLLKNRPDVPLDQEFVRTLRARLREGSVRKKTPNIYTIMQKFQYSLIGAAMCAVIAIPVIYYLTSDTPDVVKLGFDVQFDRQHDEAFGPLNVDSSYGAQGSRGEPLGLGEGVMSQTRMVPPYMRDMTNYIFDYQGDIPLPEETEISVLRRRTSSLTSGKEIARQVVNMEFDMIDMAALRQPTIKSLNLWEDTQRGYMVYLDLQEGGLSINQNWETWEQPVCDDTGCERNIQDIATFPEDDVLIATAREFLSSFGIDMSMYGEPYVDRRWRQTYEKSMQQDDIRYIPEAQQVIFPLYINDMPVYEEHGQHVGVYVTIDMYTSLVTNVHGLSTQQYDVSNYRAVQDREIMSDLLSKGGTGHPMVFEEPEKTVRIAVDTPHQAYVQMWHTKGATSSQILVPALVFPLGSTDNEDVPSFMQRVIVPLAQEVVDQLSRQSEPPVRILPVLEEPLPADGSAAYY